MLAPALSTVSLAPVSLNPATRPASHLSMVARSQSAPSAPKAPPFRLRSYTDRPYFARAPRVLRGSYLP